MCLSIEIRLYTALTAIHSATFVRLKKKFLQYIACHSVLSDRYGKRPQQGFALGAWKSASETHKACAFYRAVKSHYLQERRQDLLHGLGEGRRERSMLGNARGIANLTEPMGSFPPKSANHCCLWLSNI